MPRSVVFLLLLLAALARAAAVHAATLAACERSSPPHTLALVELYTFASKSSLRGDSGDVSGLRRRL